MHPTQYTRTIKPNSSQPVYVLLFLRSLPFWFKPVLQGVGIKPWALGVCMCWESSRQPLERERDRDTGGFRGLHKLNPAVFTDSGRLLLAVRKRPD